MAAHPRIGQPAAGPDRAAAWSRQEQAGATAGAAGAAGAAGPAVVAMAAANREYEQRFGYRFLIAAAGRTGPELLAAAWARLGNEPAAEREVVRAELAAIVRHRLERLLG